MSDGPWSPEHIYQEIVGYGKTRQRGELCDMKLSVSSLVLHCSERCGGAPGVLADEGGPRRLFEEWSSGDL